ncbi:MAG: oligosaccharide flippase family protein [Candidatus Helarchaeota archaeon]
MFKFPFLSYRTKIANAHERTKLLVKNIIADIFIKGCSIICNFLLVPLTIDFIDVNTYGIWLTLTSIIGFANFFDLGLGHGLRNRFAEAIAQNEHEKAKYYVSSAYFTLFVIIVVLAVIFTFANQYINWASVLAAPQAMQTRLNIVAAIVVYSFLLRLFFKLITSLLMARQWHAKASMVSLIGNILSLLVIYLAMKTTNGNLLILATIFSVIPIIVLFIYNIYYFSTSLRDYMPNLGYVRLNDIKALFGLGALFFLIQIAAIIQFQIGNILIAHWFGPEEVAVYNICYKYFSLITMGFSLIVAPYWSAFTDAYTRNDFIWIKNIVNRTIKLWYFFAMVGILMLVFSSSVYKLWIGNRVAIPFSLSFVMLIFTLLSSFGSIFVMFINGTGKIRLQAYTSLVSPVVFLGLSFLLTNKFQYGIEGIVLATTISNFYGPILAPVQYKKTVMQ